MERYHSGKVEKALLLALVGITCYLTDMGPGMRDYGDKCIDDAEGLIFTEYNRPTTIKVQALFLIIKYRVLSKKSPNAFMLLSIASRYASALRLNHEAPNLCFLAQESRRRLMWALYCVDSSISGGYRDYTLWTADRIHVGLPCNERNFEFDLPQATEKLIHQPSTPQVEDIGSLALYVRIQHLRRRIMEFTRRVVLSRSLKLDDVQAGVWSFQKDLADFASHLPSSFQFSESSLRLRAYSPRICVFIMIHVWWRQCHCDLYRVALVGMREALPRSAIVSLDEGFVGHCQQQCVEHALAMASIFSSMQKLNAKPVADLDLAVCAYQCARILTYAYHTNPRKFELTVETVIEQATVCLQAIKDCCVGKTTDGIKADLEKLIAHGINVRTTPSGPEGQIPIDHGFPRSQLFKNPNIPSVHDINEQAQFGNMGHSLSLGPMTDSTFPPSLVADPWVPESQVSPDLIQPVQPSQPHSAPDVSMANKTNTTNPTNTNLPEIVHRPEFGVSELNNAYEGGLEGLGLDSSMDYSMGMDQNLWIPNNDWLGVESLNGGVGA